MDVDLPPPSFPQGPRPNEYPNSMLAPDDAAASFNINTPRRSSVASGRPMWRTSFARYKSLAESDFIGSQALERPSIPNAFSAPSQVDATPLPTIPMIVLSIVGHFFLLLKGDKRGHVAKVVLGEFLSANVSTPFLVDMVKSGLSPSLFTH